MTTLVSMRTVLSALLLVFALGAAAQSLGPPGTSLASDRHHSPAGGWRDSLEGYWAHLDAEYADSATSPLTAEDRAHFTHLDHFPFDSSFCVQASFTPAEGAEPFAMKTTKTRTPTYKAHGRLRFSLDGQERTLTVYESVPPHPGYEDALFLPFTDLTNGEETYGVGRYLDLRMPLDSLVVIDFNRAYNPYCAYNDKYSCPVPPRENHLTTPVRAGVRKFHD